MDYVMHAETAEENESTARRNRIQVYKSILNYYKGRSLSLDSVLASKQPSVDIPSGVDLQEELRKSIEGLHDDIILINSMKNSLKLINRSLTSTELMRVNDVNFRGDKINKIEGIIYFSKSIMRLYNECCSELDLIEKKKSYSLVLTEYMKYLDKLKEEEKQKDEQSKQMEKMELQVYRINLVRAMKSIFIGYVSLNCPNLLRNVQTFKSSFRRNLTIDDFWDSWNVGL